MKKKALVLVSVVLVLSLLLAACAKATEAPAAATTEAPAAATTEAPAAATTEAPAAPAIKVAMILVGSISDADFNTLGYVALSSVAAKYKIDVAYTENLAVTDQERVLKEYINQGYNVLFNHSSVFMQKALEMAPQYPDTIFIVEQDADVAEADRIPNVWYIQRNYYKGFYVSGAASALASKTGNIGYVGAVDLPFQRSIMNVTQQAIDDLGLKVKINYVFTGSFDDTLKAKQAAEGLIAKGCDVLISGQNMGNFGIFSAVRDAKTKVLVVTQYTDKSALAPENIMTSEMFDFSVPLSDIVGKVIAGETGGMIPLEYGPGLARYTLFPLKNVSEEINTHVKQISDDVISGKIVPIADFGDLKLK